MNNLKNITAILVDDAEPARELLRMMLSELVPEIRIVGEAENVELAAELLKKIKPNIVFLDIKMPGKSGLQLFDEFENKTINSQVIFTTAYNEYAIQAFKLSAIDYLLKPIQENELLDAVQKAVLVNEQKQNSEKYLTLINNLQQTKNGILAVPLNYGYENIEVEKIVFFEAERNYCYIHLNDGSSKLVSKNLGYFEDVLQQFDAFIKPHRSYFVNMAHIQTFQKKGEGGEIVFKNGKKVEVSRNYRKALIDRLEN